MPIPFAELSSEDSDLYNLQLHFWRNAVEHFAAIRAKAPVYRRHDADFVVDACMVIVLAGTSASQLLGQQWVKTGSSDEVVPLPSTLLRNLARKTPPATVGFPTTLTTDFEKFISIYNNVRHFGEPKHEVVAKINPVDLCRYMNLIQDVWKYVAKVRDADPMPNEAEFDRTFDLPADL